MAQWVGWLGARSAVSGGCFQLWRGGESAVAWWQGGDTSLAPPGMILVLAKKAEGGGTPPELSATPLFWQVQVSYLVPVSAAVVGAIFSVIFSQSFDMMRAVHSSCRYLCTKRTLPHIPDTNP